MKKVIFAILFLACGVFALDSLVVNAIPRSQRIDTIKAYVELPSWSYINQDTTYLKRNGIVKVRLQFVNPGLVVVADTTVVFRPTMIGFDSLRVSPYLKLMFKN